MKIGISGSNGFVGSHLKSYLSKMLQAEIVSIPRNLLYEDPKEMAVLLKNCQIIINLAGASVASRWTKKRMQELRCSRIATTQNLARAISLLNKKPKLFISTSAVGIYDDTGLHDEFSENYSNGFLSLLCQEWEAATKPISAIGVRTVIFRLGLVLSLHGGMLKKIIPFFKLGLGGKMGNGQQTFPFVHLEDLLRAYKHVILNDQAEGIYNLVAPEIITNFEFTRSLKLHFKKPSFFTVPAFLLNLVFLRGSDVLLIGQKVVSERLKTEGFSFQRKTINDIYG